jgi:hypothetical protein
VAQRTSARGRKISKDFTSPARELKKKKRNLEETPSFLHGAFAEL